MTETQIRKLAKQVAIELMANGFLISITDMIVERIILEQKKIDKEFQNKMTDMQVKGFGPSKITTEEEILLGELAKLQTMLHLYEEKEEYEKAQKINNKIKLITLKLNNL